MKKMFVLMIVFLKSLTLFAENEVKIISQYECSAPSVNYFNQNVSNSLRVDSLILIFKSDLSVEIRPKDLFSTLYYEPTNYKTDSSGNYLFTIVDVVWGFDEVKNRYDAALINMSLPLLADHVKVLTLKQIKGTTMLAPVFTCKENIWVN